MECAKFNQKTAHTHTHTLMTRSKCKTYYIKSNIQNQQPKPGMQNWTYKICVIYWKSNRKHRHTVWPLFFDHTNFLGLYHIVFQLLGDWWMLVGLLVLAFSPMIYLAFGMYYRITRHMTDNSISRAMQSINIASSVVAVIGNSAEVVHVWISPSENLLPTISWNQELFADHRPLQSALACFMSSSDRAKMLEENRHSTEP